MKSKKIMTKTAAIAMTAALAAAMTGCAGMAAAPASAPAPAEPASTAAEEDTGEITVGEERVYEDANGWSVRYDPNLFTVNGGGPMVTFVYTGESAGTNMITASYNADKDAKTAILDLSKEWGDKAPLIEGVFPGTEDVKGYFLSLPPGEGGSGLYSTTIARDYMDGYLLFEVTGHNSGNDEADMAVSDALAGVIDSLEFTTYNE